MTQEQLELGKRIDREIKNISYAIQNVKMDGFYEVPTWFIEDIIRIGEESILNLKQQFEQL